MIRRSGGKGLRFVLQLYDMYINSSWPLDNPFPSRQLVSLQFSYFKSVQQYRFSGNTWRETVSLQKKSVYVVWRILHCQHLESKIMWFRQDLTCSWVRESGNRLSTFRMTYFKAIYLSSQRCLEANFWFVMLLMTSTIHWQKAMTPDL